LGAIVLCRHGTTENNAAGHFLSRTDSALNASGRAECRRLALALSIFSFERCLVSPMRRALETREIVAPELAFEIDSQLREVDYGLWEGRTLQWLQVHDPDGLARRRRDPVHFRPPQGESFADLSLRLPRLVERLNGMSNVLVIGHRGTLGVLERLLRDLPLDSQSVTPLEPAEFHVINR
jgi:broad specificity phosphatase PhoE